MKWLSNILKKLMTRLLNQKSRKLALLFLATTSLLLSTLQTQSYAIVKQTGSDTVEMTGNDLYNLIDGYERYKAEAEATREALDSERQAHMEYTRDVAILMERQEEERKTYQEALKSLEKKLNAPAVELYGGYNTNDKWEGGVRLIWRLW